MHKHQKASGATWLLGWVMTVHPIKGDKKRPFIKREAKEVWGKYTPYMMKTTY